MNRKLLEKLLILCIFLLLWSLVSIAQTWPFTLRQTWDGRYDIKMIAAPNVEAAYIDATRATDNSVKVDSIISCETIQRTGDLININNDFKPFGQTKNITISSFACPMGVPCPQGYNLASTTTCPNNSQYKSVKTVSRTVSLVYADYDNDKSTFSSTRARFQIAGCGVEIEAAYLYWVGRGGDGSFVNYDASKSYVGGNVGGVNKSTYKTIKLKTPSAANYVNVTSQWDYTTTTAADHEYVCIANVTSLVKGETVGDFWVANIQTYPDAQDGGTYSGWTMIIIYKSAESAPRKIFLWDGLESIDKGTSTQLTLSGLVSPATNNFKSYIGFGVLDGENLASEVSSPEALVFQTNNGGVVTNLNPNKPYQLYNAKGEPANSSGSSVVDACKRPDFSSPLWATGTDGVSSSHITSYDEKLGTNGNEINRTPSCTNTYGFDVHHMLLPNGAISTSATAATMKIQAGNQGGTSPFLAYIAIETLQPKLELAKEVSTTTTKLNNVFDYSLKITNNGGLKSLGDVLDYVTDTLDEAVDFVVGSVTSSPAGASLTSSASNILKFNLPVIDIGKTVTINFKVKVKDFSAQTIWKNACKRSIINSAYIQYKAPDGKIFTNISNATDCEIGTYVETLVFDPVLDADQTIDIGPIDISSLASKNIVDEINKQLAKKGVLATDLDLYTKFDVNYDKFVPSTEFSTNLTQIFYAIRKYSTTGKCREIYKLTFVTTVKPTFTQDTTDVSCNGLSDGTLQAIADFGVNSGQIKYTLVKGSVTTAAQFASATILKTQALSSTLTFTANALSKGLYTVVAEDSYATPYFLQYNIDEPLVIVVNLQTAPVCKGDSAVVTIASITGRPIGTMYSYSWQSSTNGTNWSNEIDKTSSIMKPILQDTWYRLSAKDGVCSNYGDVKVSVNAVPSLATSQDQTYCLNSPTATFKATASGTLKWYNTAVSATGTSIVPTQATTTDGVYSRFVSNIVTSNGISCESPRIETKITILPKPVNPVAVDGTYCLNTGVKTFEATGTGTINWYTAYTGGTASAIKPTQVTTTSGSFKKYASQIITTTGVSCESDRIPVNITVNAKPNSPLVSDATYCINVGSKQYDATASGSLLWYDNASITTSSNVVPTVATTSSGTYVKYVTQTVASNGISCESDRVPVTIIVNKKPVNPNISNAVYCLNSGTQTYKATGTGNLTWYEASQASSGYTITPTQATNTSNVFTKYVSNSVSSNGISCTSDTIPVTITVNAKPVPPTVTDKVYCLESGNQSFVASGTDILKWYTTASGGTASITTPNQSTAVGGIFTAYVSQKISSNSVECESDRVPVTITVNAKPTAPVAVAQTFCFKSGDHAFSATASGQLNWYDNASGGTASTLIPSQASTKSGLYTKYVSSIETKNGISCESDRTAVTIQINDKAQSPTPIDAAYCLNVGDQTYKANGTGLLVWYNALADIKPLSSTPTQSTNADGDFTQYVSQTIVSNGISCESEKQAVKISVKAKLTAPTAQDAVYCLNTGNQTYTATGTGTLNWYDNLSGGTVSLIAPSQATIVKGSFTKYVSQVISMNGVTCESDRAAVIITVNDKPASPVAIDSSICINSKPITFSATATGVITWYDQVTGGGVGSSISPSQTTNISGVYTKYASNTISVNAVTCESDRVPVKITIKPNPVLTISPSKTICYGSSTIVSVSGDASSYLWDKGLGTASSNTVSPLVNTKYHVTGTLDGCSDSASVLIYVNPKILITPGNDTTICKGDSILLKSEGNALSYAWDNGLGGGKQHTVSPNATTSYGVTGTYNGCTLVDNITVGVYALPTVTISPASSEICQGTSLSLQGQGAQNYTWSHSVIDGITFIPKATTTYFVTGTDAHHCKNTASTLVTVNVIPTVSITGKPSLCFGENEQLTATGADAFVWSSGETTAIVQNIPATSYTVSVTGTTKNCSSSAQYSVKVFPLPTISIQGVTAICVGESLTISAMGAKTYLWNDGTAIDHFQVKPNTTIQYSVTGTSIDNCVASTSATIIVKPLPTIIITGNTPICAGDSLHLTASGADTYIWNTGVSKADVHAKPSNGTIFSVEGTSNACKSSQSVTAVVKALPIISFTGNNPICDGESLTVSAKGANSYVWSDASTNSSITVKPSNQETFSVTGTTNGCVSFSTFSATVKPVPFVDLGPDQIKCSNDKVSLNASSNAATYKWNDGFTSPLRTISAPGGLYYVDVTNNGCTIRDSITIDYTYLPDFTILGPPVIYLGDTAYYEVSKEFAAYYWNTSELKRNIKPVPNDGDKFWVQVSDQYHCIDTAFITTKVLPRPEINIKDRTICTGENTILTVKDKFDTYEWNTGEKTKSITVTKGGQYIIKASRINEPGISLIDTIQVKEIALPVFAMSNDTAICEGDYAHLSAEYQSVYSYVWSNWSIQNSIDVKQAGNYVVKVTAFGCSSFDTVHVAVNPIPPAPILSGRTEICYNESSPTLQATGQNVQWFTTDSPLAFFTGNTFTADTIYQDSPEYQVTQTVKSCMSPASSIAVHRRLEYKGLKIVSPNDLFCKGYAMHVPFTVVGAFKKPQWNITGDNIIYLQNNENTYMSVDFMGEGTDTLYVTTSDSIGCIYSASKVVTVSPLPVADYVYYSGFGKVQYTNISDTAVIEDVKRVMPNNYYWDFAHGDSLHLYNELTNTVKYPEGYYDVTLIAINEAGCSDTAVKHIYVDSEHGMFVPNAFTPDALSPELSHFRPKAFGLAKYDISIFDTWGNLLWYSDKLINGQPAEGWDGKYDGTVLKLDSYVWKINAIFDGGEVWQGQKSSHGKRSKFGNVLLLR